MNFQMNGAFLISIKSGCAFANASQIGDLLHDPTYAPYRKKLHGLLCSNCQEIFFVSKLMREFCIPLDSQLTQPRDRGGLEYVGTAVHHFFRDLEKIVRHFFRTNKMST